MPMYDLWEQLNAGCVWRDMAQMWSEISTTLTFSEWARNCLAVQDLFGCLEILGGCPKRGIYLPRVRSDDSGPAFQRISGSFSHLNQVF